MPIRAPISVISEICATHGVITEMKAPEKNPYIAQNTMICVTDFAKSQNTTQRSPERNAEGTSKLKRPMVSER